MERCEPTLASSGSAAESPRISLWRALGQSVRGASHQRSGLPNQDALRWLPPHSRSPQLALAVADGHGSPTYFRSHVGAQVAVQAATDLLWEMAATAVHLESPLQARQLALHQLPQLLVRRWSEQVLAHVSHLPITNTEWAGLEQHAAAGARARLEANPRLAYGSTLVAALVTPAYLLYMQLGDGDILTVADDGTVCRPPLPTDERLLANQTTSLCGEGAHHNIRLYLQPLISPPPALILLATDGYANSYAEPAGFQAVGRDLLQGVRIQGAAWVEEQLEGWLLATSAAGSGDDITVALALRSDLDGCRG